MLALLSACKETSRESSTTTRETSTSTTVNEPAGAQTTNNVPQTVPRDFNQRAYPGMDPASPASTDRRMGY